MGALILDGLAVHRVHPVADATQPGSLRREVGALARNLHLPDETAGRLAIVATELGTNLVKHAAGGGEVLFRPAFLGGVPGVELVALDRGPGMMDPAAMLQDGRSTSGSPGTGLGAIQRLSDEFALYSVPGVGTAVLSRIWARAEHLPPVLPRFQWGAVILPKPGETECGDSWAMAFIEAEARVLVVDGLGHGAGAAVAAGEAVREFSASPGRTAPDAMAALHRRLHPTRGAAAVVAEIRTDHLAYVGVGNIFGRILAPGHPVRGLVTMNGTVGNEPLRLQAFRYDWPEGATLLLNSDGVSSNWNLDAYPGLARQHPAFVAALMYRDQRRGSDDLTVVALRNRKPGWP